MGEYSTGSSEEYAQGLFKYAMHINYLGDIILFTGFALLTHNLFMLIVPFLMAINFVFSYIPMMDKQLAGKYGNEFKIYAKTTKKLIPFIY